MSSGDVGARAPKGAVCGGGAAWGRQYYLLKTRILGCPTAEPLHRRCSGRRRVALLFIASVNGEDSVNLFNFCHNAGKLGCSANADSKHCAEVTVFKSSCRSLMCHYLALI